MLFSWTLICLFLRGEYEFSVGRILPSRTPKLVLREAEILAITMVCGPPKGQSISTGIYIL